MLLAMISTAGAAIFTWWNITRPDRQQAVAQAQEQERMDKLFRSAEQAVRSLLRDPDSAQFKELSIRIGQDSKRYVCGQVNVKNAFGGYAGFDFFAFEIANGPAYLMATGASDALFVLDACQAKPLDVKN